MQSILRPKLLSDYTRRTYTLKQPSPTYFNSLVRSGSQNDLEKFCDQIETNDYILNHIDCTQLLKRIPTERVVNMMMSKKVRSDHTLLTKLAKSCDSLDVAKKIESTATHLGTQYTNILIAMYSRFGSLMDCQRLFAKAIKTDPMNIWTWNSMLWASARHTNYEETYKIFQEMQQHLAPDDVSWSAILSTCNAPNYLPMGRQLHSQINEAAASSTVLNTNLIQMYVNCGDEKSALRMFNKMQQSRDQPNRITWTILLRSIASHNIDQALDKLNEMISSGIEPDSLCWSALIQGCKDSGSLTSASKIHQLVKATKDPIIQINLIDMYTACGDINAARHIFDDISNQDRTPDIWAAMVRGYANHGDAAKAIHLFKESQTKDVPFSEILSTAAINACAHVGWVDQAYEIFNQTKSSFQLRNYSYNAMVDVLSRAGRLKEAEDLIQEIPRPDAMTWTALLGGCKIHLDLDRGERAFRKLQEIDPVNSSGYVLLSNLYAALGKPQERTLIRRSMDQHSIKKVPGFSRIEIDGKSHEFFVEDQNHPQIQAIEDELKKMFGQMEEMGYQHNFNVLLRDFETQDDAKQHLCRHSEKLAIGYGLISTPPKTALKITKNLRICEDCHASTKMLAKLTEREISIRDANRWHHFRDGKCSCNDYF
eukprot:TRINITY_DN21480_c0_g1_i1.p1 TRINITY_DN21480_c0_g1~~TRINITY_DN21480_c0_g1_i1.p1  ORF type:complete len:653 (-),score=132.00 TRINITY_DN21480_c0_g1_i1:35-1993(-)